MVSFLYCRSSYCLTAGSDRIVRYWDLSNGGESSYHITKPEQSNIKIQQTKVQGRLENTTVVLEEQQAENALTDKQTIGERRRGTGNWRIKEIVNAIVVLIAILMFELVTCVFFAFQFLLVLLVVVH